MGERTLDHAVTLGIVMQGDKCGGMWQLGSMWA